MACLRPIKIAHPSDRDLPFLQRRLIEVPCGSCECCKHKKQNDYYVRAAFEYKKCCAANGLSLFCTFTFADKYIPVKYGRYCFDKKLVQKFLHDVNMCLRRHFNACLKYMVFSEVGHTGTIRPHHHALFFIYPLDNNTIITYQLVNILKEIAVCWRYGISDCAPVDPERGGIRYVTKYSAKDVAEESVLADVVDAIVRKYCGAVFVVPFFGEDGEVLELDIVSNKDRKISTPFGEMSYFKYHVKPALDAFRHRYQPFTLVSQGVGDNAPVTLSDIVENKPVVIGGFEYSIPRYFVQRVQRNQQLDQTFRDNAPDDIVSAFDNGVPVKRYKYVPKRLHCAPSFASLVLSPDGSWSFKEKPVPDLYLTDDIVGSVSKLRKIYEHDNQYEILRKAINSCSSIIKDTFGIYPEDVPFLDSDCDVIDPDSLSYVRDMLRAQSTLISEARLRKKSKDMEKKRADKASYNRKQADIEEVIKNSHWCDIYDKTKHVSRLHDDIDDLISNVSTYNFYKNVRRFRKNSINKL